MTYNPLSECNRNQLMRRWANQLQSVILSKSFKNSTKLIVLPELKLNLTNKINLKDFYPIKLF